MCKSFGFASWSHLSGASHMWLIGFTSAMWDVDEQSSNLKCLRTLKDDELSIREVKQLLGQWWIGSSTFVG